MKAPLFLYIAILIILSYSCNKPDPPSFDFYVSGVANVAFDGDSSIVLPLEIKYLGGQPEMVALTLSDAPADIVGDFSTASGIPGYTSLLTFTGNNADVGMHTVTLTAKSASGTTKTYPFSMQVNPMKDCTKQLAGSYNNVDCTQKSTVSKIEKISGTANRVKIGMPYYYSGITVRATVDCDLKTIKIDTTVMGMYPIISGSGTFSGKTVIINYHIQTTPTDTFDCTATMNKL